MEKDFELPLPAATASTKAYWKAANEGRLIIQRCNNCKRTQFYPREFCVSCLSDDLDWITTTGRGHIYTYTICHIPGHPALAGRTPYAIAMIDLEEGVRMLSEVVETGLGHLAIGAPVEVVFQRIAPECSLPKFRVSL